MLPRIATVRPKARSGRPMGTPSRFFRHRDRRSPPRRTAKGDAHLQCCAEVRGRYITSREEGQRSKSGDERLDVRDRHHGDRMKPPIEFMELAHRCLNIADEAGVRTRHHEHWW